MERLHRLRIEHQGENLPDREPKGPERSNHIRVDLEPMQWYSFKQEVGMILKVLIGVLLGGAAGFGLSYLTRGIGSS